MAKLGVRTIDELVGRTDLLHVKPSAPGSRSRQDEPGLHPCNPAMRRLTASTFVKEDTYDFHLEGHPLT